MKKLLLILCFSFVLIILIGCRPDIKTTNTKEMRFLNNPDITFQVTENILSDNNGIIVHNGYYMPEVSLLCFDIEFINHDSNYTYMVSFSFEDSESNTQGSYTYNGVSPAKDSKMGQVCLPEVKYDSYVTHIYRYFDHRKDIILATIEYVDTNYDKNDLFNLRITHKELNTVEVLGDPYIRFDIVSDKDPKLIPGIINFRLYDGKDIYLENTINKEDFVLDGDQWVIKDITFDGLVPSYRFMMQFTYQPIDDMDKVFEVGQRTEDYAITSATMEGFTNNCLYSYLCAHVYGSRIDDNLVIFSLYYYNDVTKLNPDTSLPHKVYFKVFDDNHQEIFVEEVTTNFVSVPLVILSGEHRIELESDILIIIEDEENDFYDQFYEDLDVRYVVDGDLYGN